MPINWALQSLIQDILSQIENSKENVQPLATGRNIETLTAKLKGLQQKPITNAAQLFDEGCVEWENKIQDDVSDDPLHLWNEYIKWAQQQTTSDKLAGHIVPLLQRCTRLFQNDIKYKDDPRYVQIWMRYADTVYDPADIFTFLECNGIGQKSALFYVSWARMLESKKNMFSEAYSKLEEGLKQRAQPAEHIQMALHQFQHRMNQRTMEAMKSAALGLDIPQAQDENPGSVREFGDQITKSRRMVKPAAVSQMTLGVSARPAAARTAEVKGVGNSGGFSIFVDSSGDGAHSSTNSNGSWKALPSEKERSKENTRSATQWNKEVAGTIPQKKASMLPSRNLVAKAGIDFDMFVDEELKEAVVTEKQHRPVRLQLESVETLQRTIQAEQRQAQPLNFLDQ